MFGPVAALVLLTVIVVVILTVTVDNGPIILTIAVSTAASRKKGTRLIFYIQKLPINRRAAGMLSI